MKEEDSDFFFGRERETVEVLNTLAKAPGQLPVLLGNSGVGKSSLAQAGVLAALEASGLARPGFSARGPLSSRLAAVGASSLSDQASSR